MGLSNERARRIKNKIQQSRARLLVDKPFFALLLMYVKFVAIPGMKKISTNGSCIYFDPNFIDKLYDAELDFALSHQIMHILLGHIWRPFDFEGDDYQFACDIIVNQNLTHLGFGRNKYSHLGEVHYFAPCNQDKDFSTATPKEVCEVIPYSLSLLEERTRNRYMFDNDSFWDKKKEDIGEGILILDIPENEGRLKIENAEDECGSGSGKEKDGQDGDGEATKADWQGRAALAAKFAAEKGSGKGAGSIPEFLERLLAGKKEPIVDWRKILDSFIQERICDYSFVPPDRRFSDCDFFLPDFNEKEFVSKEILFMVDTSGSVDDETLGAVYNEICSAVEQFGGKLQGKLGFFDCQVTTPVPFETVDDILHIIPYGGGGTNFEVIFDYIRYNCIDDLPACVVIFTDGEGPYPDESETMNIPTLWMLDNIDITPPFGKIARIIADAVIMQ